MNDKVAKIFELANLFNCNAVLAEVVKNDPEMDDMLYIDIDTSYNEWDGERVTRKKVERSFEISLYDDVRSNEEMDEAIETLSFLCEVA
ncbi:hypothetical protein [Eubacterium maltosivorans]|uniref:Uncharacterized protein n=1 Tax=Eubacterium maltosivorans TaxID=2041044 RepID=A0A4P9C8Z7_EUBML|nr:hypothetical protein [Eubacterium maltosivorans]QCT71122.1 hypothetical protein CPZ25_007210 [Eubacterium maltosivorans]